MNKEDKIQMAFPHQYSDAYSLGMTLRDYFASRASDKDIEDHQAPWLEKESPPLSNWTQMIPTYSREVAKFKYADAMIKARNSNETISSQS